MCAGERAGHWRRQTSGAGGGTRPWGRGGGGQWNGKTTGKASRCVAPPPPPPHTSRCWSRQTPCTDLGCACGCPWSTARATAPSPGRPTPGVVKQDKSSGGSVDTTNTRSGPQPPSPKGAFSHSAGTAPIITVIIQVTAPKTTRLRNHAQSIQNSKIQTSDACHGSQGPKFCPL